MDVMFDLDLDKIDEKQIDHLLDKTRQVTEIITKEQLKTQSRVTSLYGCNLNGSLEETNKSELSADDILGRQLVLVSGSGKINISGNNIGGLVLANINKDPPTKRSKRGKIVRTYRANELGHLEITINSRITNLVITNCKDITLNLKNRIKVSIELINSNDIRLNLTGFPFFRSICCDSIQINDNIENRVIFDIRRSLRIHVNGCDMRFNPHSETRYEYLDGSLVRLRDEDDIFGGFNGPRSVPDITMTKLYRT